MSHIVNTTGGNEEKGETIEMIGFELPMSLSGHGEDRYHGGGRGGQGASVSAGEHEARDWTRWIYRECYTYTVISGS